MDHVTARRLQDEFKLPAVLAREIDAEQTRQALLHHWQPWAWLLCWLLLPSLAVWVGWLPSYLQLIHDGMLVLPMAIALVGWICIARWLAGPAMRIAAAAKARRLGIDIKENAAA
jgi:hypothetical protein